MSINVTVNGNPVSINRGRMVLNDLDEIKKNERDRRRKLRLEQVREQSKQISNRLLERAKNVTKSQLTRLEKDGRSELRQIHDQKIMNLQRKYQEDMEDIGRAHASASIQPDVKASIEIEKKKNRFVALERGKEAMHRLKESNQIENDNGALHERQKQVRDMENARAFMIANLPKKLSTGKELTDQDSDSGSEKIIRKSIKKKRERKGNNKFHKSIPKVVVQSPDVQVVVSDPKAKRSDREPGPSRLGMRKTETADSKRSYASSKTITDISEFPSVGVRCESDNQEPRKSLPKYNSPSKADKVASYNPEDYKPDSSSSGSNSSSNGSTSLSDDSSYFSDGGGIDSSSFVRKKTPRHTTSAASSKVQLYDHDTRQRNVYEKPFGIVERIKIDGEPNAEELAHAVTESENVDSHLTENRRREALRRGNDAILRDKVRRDYKNLLENLDHLSREERKLKASQIHGPLIKDIHLNPVRRKELLAKRQRDMEYAFESNLPDRNEEDEEFFRASERVVTIPANDHEKEGEDEETPSAVWNEPPFFEPSSNVVDKNEIDVDKNDREISRNEQILDMLRKVERQKRLLLKEFGADLPDDVFTASVKPLFSENITRKSNGVEKKLKKSPTPDIRVINMSSCDENDNKKLKKLKNNVVTTSPKKIEIAVQTSSIDDEKSVAFDKSVQVELINGTHDKRSTIDSNSTSEEMIVNKKSDEDYSEELESNSVSSDSVETGIVIDIKKKRVKLTPKKKRSNIRISKGNSPRVVAKPRSVSGSKISTPVKRHSKSAPVSKQSTPRLKESDLKPIRIKEKKVKIELDKGNIKVKINPKVNEDSSSRDASTESSKSIPTDILKDRMVPAPVLKNHTIKPRDTSDTSTSYTSPPPPTPASYRSARDNSTPILEILESSKGGETILKKREISPVSSPGTPSPRTINLPTNTPHSRHINRVLEYFDSTISQSTDNTISISLPGRQSTPNELPNFTKKKGNISELSDKSLDICLCKNPECKLTHLNMRELDNETLKNYPEILQKYQNLKIICTDRIASLTDLIEKVRNDKKGIELSVGGQSDDESSIFLLPGATRMSGDLYSVRKLVDSIEAVHNQLAKTIDESQRIIGVKKQSKHINSLSKIGTGSIETDENSPINSSDAQSSSGNNSHNQESRNRVLPRVISSELVNVPLSQFNIIPKEQKPILQADEKKNNFIIQEEDVVERLSKEILEQSKTLDNILPDVYSTKINESNDISDSSPPRRKSPSSPKKQPDDGSKDLKNQSGTFSTSGTKPEKDADFVPLLAGIPKVQRMLPSTSDNRRPRPPVTLIHGPHSVQAGSPGHELSTIVEFDTPDTASKSQRSVRSPTITDEKSRKNLLKNYQSQMIKSQSLPQTENRSPLDSSSQFRQATHPTPESVNKISESSPGKRKSKKGDKGKEIIFRDAGTSSGYCDSEKDCELISCPKSVDKNLEVSEKQREDNSVSKKEVSSDSSCSIPDISAEFTKRNLLFHARMVTATETTSTPFRSIKDSQQQQIIKCLSNDVEKDKITSTSSNSFSGLSGISEITSTPTSDILKYTSSPEEMETALKKLGLGWAITTLKKTREASALSSSSNSDTTPIIQQSRKLTLSSSSPVSKKDIESKINCLTNLSDVSSISIKNANKSTERAILLKARTSTPNIEHSNSSCEKNSSSTTNSSSRGGSLQDQSDSLTAPNLSLVTNKKSPTFDKQLNGA